MVFREFIMPLPLFLDTMGSLLHLVRGGYEGSGWTST